MVLLTAGCRKEPSPASHATAGPSVSTRVVAVEPRALWAFEDVVGTVRSRLRSAVEAKIPGRIESVRAVPGQSVKPGELLVTLDAREAQARLESAVAVREQATRDLQRVSRLEKDGAATQSELDAVRARSRVAEAAVSEAETILGYTRVTAPFGGVITRKLADVGDLASPGRALLEIEDPTVLRFEADVPEALLDRISPGMKLPVRVASGTNVLGGTVSEIAPVADPASRTFLVKLDLPLEAGLRAGQFGRMAVPTGGDPVPQVPTTAVFRRGQIEYVWVVLNGRSQLRMIRTGKQDGTWTEILAGLSPGESVVVSGAAVAHEGQPVDAK